MDITTSLTTHGQVTASVIAAAYNMHDPDETRTLSVTLQRIHEASLLDPECTTLAHQIQSGFPPIPDALPEMIRPYWRLC